MKMKYLILLLISVCLTGAAPAADPVPPAAAALHMRLTFDESFHQPLSWCSEVCNGQRWRTKFFHSGDTPFCLPSFISRFAVAGSAEIDRRRGHCHGTQQGAVPEGAQRSGIRRAVWHGGQVPRCGDGLTLAERL